VRFYAVTDFGHRDDEVAVDFRGVVRHHENPVLLCKLRDAQALSA